MWSCSICLDDVGERGSATGPVWVEPCWHGYCKRCILRWRDQSMRCPLCTREMERIVEQSGDGGSGSSPLWREVARARPKTSTRSDRPGSPSLPSRERPRRYASTLNPDLVQQLARRRAVYHERKVARYIASNPYTRFRPSISPADFERESALLAKCSSWIRRELRVFTYLTDESLEWTRRYILTLLVTIDFQTRQAHEAVAAFLGKRDAEIFIHELLVFARSPFTTLTRWDAFVHYDDRPGKRDNQVVPAVTHQVSASTPQRPNDATKRAMLLARLEREKRELSRRARD